MGAGDTADVICHRQIAEAARTMRAAMVHTRRVEHPFFAAACGWVDHVIDLQILTGAPATLRTTHAEVDVLSVEGEAVADIEIITGGLS